MSDDAMRSHLLTGTVRHRRAGDVSYALEHQVDYLALDLDELDLVDRSFRLVGRNRRTLLEFRDRDHWPEPASDLRAAVHAHLRSEGVDPTGWRITLVAYPRVLGYVFNPASFYLCRDAEGVLRIVVVEVHNTHLERHLYTLQRADDPASVRADEPGAAASGDRRHGPDRFRGAMDKAFYVSPFLDMEGRYAVHVQDDPTRLRIAIDERRDGRHVLSASLVLERRRLSDRTVLRRFVANPLVTHKTMALIHWHALRLWRLGVPFRRHRDVALPGGVPRHGGPSGVGVPSGAGTGAAAATPSIAAHGAGGRP